MLNEQIRLKSPEYYKIFAGLKSYIANEWPFLVTFCFFFGWLIGWVCLDHTVPSWDSAAHLSRSYHLKDIVLSASTTLEKKIGGLFTTSWVYPPLFNWVHCLFLMAPLPPTVADNLPRLVFFAIGIISLYKLGRLLFNDAAIGLVAMIIFCMLPLVCAVIHTRGLLDLPLTSMCFLAFWLITRWDATPSVANSLAAGFAIGLACLTKQMGVVFMAPAISLVVLQRLLARDFGRIIQFSYGLGLAAILYLSWLFSSLEIIRRYLNQLDQARAPQAGGFPHWLSDVNLYLQNVSYDISIPVSLVFFLSLFNFAGQRKLWLSASTFLSILILCSLRVANCEDRYVMPVLGYVALSIAALLVRLWRSGSLLLRILDVAFGLYLLTIYFVFNFTPYPFPCATVLEGLKVRFNGYRSYQPGVFPGPPESSEPGRYNWLLDHLQSGRLEKQIVVISVLNHRYCEPQAIHYLAKQRRIGSFILRPLIKCLPPIRTQCNPLEVELNPDWYLTTTDAESVEGKYFVSAQDLDNYNRFRNYFETSGDFSKVGEFPLPDGQASMVLYRKQVQPPSGGP